MKSNVMSLVSALVLASISVSGTASAQTTIVPQTAAVQFITTQPSNEWLAGVFIGAKVQNAAGETVGDIYDLMFSPQGQINTVVIGVGGFLGMGERTVAIPYNTLSFKAGAKGERIIVVPLSKDNLVKAPDFKATERTTFQKAEDKAVDLGQKTVDKAVELKDKAAAKIEDMKKTEPVKK